MKICFFKTGAMGDILMTTPLVRAVRKKYPEAQIDYWVGKSFKSVIKENQNLSKIYSFDGNMFHEYNLKKIINLAKKIKKEKYDLVFVLDIHWIFSLFFFLVGIKERIGFLRDLPSKFFLTKYIKYGRVRHALIYYLDLLSTIKKVDYEDTQMDFYVDSKTEENIKMFLNIKKNKDYFAFINSGGDNGIEQGSVRRLPDDVFVKLIEKLRKKSKILLVGGEEDSKYYDKFNFGDNVINLAGKFNLKESAALLKFAKRIYSTDCGPMHLGASVNEHMTCYFGPTNPKRKAPLIKDCKSIWKDQDIYDEKYELYGKVPKGKFFEKI